MLEKVHKSKKTNILYKHLTAVRPLDKHVNLIALMKFNNDADEVIEKNSCRRKHETKETRASR